MKKTPHISIKTWEFFRIRILNIHDIHSHFQLLMMLRGTLLIHIYILIGESPLMELRHYSNCSNGLYIKHADGMKSPR